MAQAPNETSPEQEDAAAERDRRRRLLILTLLLLVGLPLYIIAAAFLASAINPIVVSDSGEVTRALPWYVEIVVYAALGLVWALPLKSLSKGLGRRGPKPGR